MEFALDELGVAERLADRLIHIFKDCGIPKFSIPYQCKCGKRRSRIRECHYWRLAAAFILSITASMLKEPPACRCG